jgi:hypothetical protein
VSRSTGPTCSRSVICNRHAVVDCSDKSPGSRLGAQISEALLGSSGGTSHVICSVRSALRDVGRTEARNITVLDQGGYPGARRESQSIPPHHVSRRSASILSYHVSRRSALPSSIMGILIIISAPRSQAAKAPDCVTPMILSLAHVPLLPFAHGIDAVCIVIWSCVRESSAVRHLHRCTSFLVISGPGGSRLSHELRLCGASLLPCFTCACA